MTIYRYVTPEDRKRLSYLLYALHDGARVCIDVETRSDGGGKKNLEDWHPSSRVVSLSLSWDEDNAHVVSLSHPATETGLGWKIALQAIALACKTRGFRIVGHNIKYDLRWIARHTGVDLSQQIHWCTQAAAHIIDENVSHGLKVRAVEDVGVEPWGDIDLSDAEKADWDELSEYNGLDTINTLKLAHWQMDVLRKDKPRGKVLYYITRPAIQTLTRVELRGMQLDVGEVDRRLLEAKWDRQHVYTWLMSRAPTYLINKHIKFKKIKDENGEKKTIVQPYSWAPTSLFFKEYAETHWPVLERTPKGEPSWSGAVMKRLARKGYDDAKKVLELRKIDKQISTYLSRWPNDADENGRIYPTYKPSTVVTGRLSCERPNLQQVDKKLKPCFLVPVQADYSQIEVRLMAHVSGDENLRRVYNENRDVYNETGAVILNKPAEDLTDHERFTMKAVVLGFLYGMMPNSFVNYSRDVFGIDISKDEAKRFRDGFFEQYPGVAVFHEKQRRLVRTQGYVDSPLGRRRRLPEINSRVPTIRFRAERQAINSPIQGMASDIMMIALDDIDKNYDPEDVRVVGTVHDSGLLEIADSLSDDDLVDIGNLMVKPDLSRFGVDLAVPLVVEFEVGVKWGEPSYSFKVYG